jgi:hypothetical protein
MKDERKPESETRKMNYPGIREIHGKPTEIGLVQPAAFLAFEFRISDLFRISYSLWILSAFTYCLSGAGMLTLPSACW